MSCELWLCVNGCAIAFLCCMLLCVVFYRNGSKRFLKVVFFDGGQNIKNRGVFAAARQDVGPFFFYLMFNFWLIF